MKKIIASLVGLVLVLALLAFVLVIYLEPIVEYAAPKVARHYGVQIKDLEIDHLSASELMVSQFDASYAQNDLSIKIIAQNVLINLSINSVIQSVIQSAQINELTVQIDTNVNQSSTVSHDQTIEKTIADLPIIPISINKLNLSYAVNDQQLASLQARLNVKKNYFNFGGQISTSLLPTSQMDIEVSEHGNVSLALKDLDTRADILDWQGSVQKKENKLLIAMHGDTHFSRMQNYLHAVYSAPVKVVEDDSFTKMDIEVDLGQPLSGLVESLLVNLHLDTQAQLRTLTNDIKTVYLDAEIDCTLSAMSAIDCVLDQPIHAELLLQDSSTLFKDYFAVDEKNYLIELAPIGELAIHAQTTANNEMRIAGAVKIEMKAANMPLSLKVACTENQWHYADKLSVSLAYDAELKIQGLKNPVEVGAAQLGMQGRVAFDGQQLDMQIDEAGKMAFSKIKHEDIVINELVMSLRKPFRAQYVVDNEEIDIQEVLINMSPMRISMNDILVKTGHTHVKFDNIKQKNKSWSAVVNTSMDKFAISQSDVHLKIFNIDNHAELKDDQISFGGNFLVSEDEVLLEYQGFHHITRQQGNLNASLNDFPLAKSQLARQLIKSSGLPMQVKAGVVGLVTDVVWGPQLADNISMQLDMQLRNIDGYYAQNNFTGLNAGVAVNGWNSWLLTKPIALRLDEFNIGFPVTNISLDVTEIKKPADGKASISIDQFSAQALDGSVLAKELEIDFNRAVNEFTIYLFNLSLEKLLALNQTEDLIVNGVFNGELPIKLENDRISIKNGWLKVNEKGGIIKYTRIKDILSGDPNVEILAEMLDNFHYDELSAELNMQPDGQTILAAKIFGSNPNIKNGGDVSLNPNIEINLLKMLYNLRLMSRVAEELTNQVIENEAVR
jgi:hypothetical protein